MVILDKLKDADDRTWYASQAVENGWSRKVLQAQIATDLRGRQGGALTLGSTSSYGGIVAGTYNKSSGAYASSGQQQSAR